MELNKIYNGDCLEVLKTFPDNCFDSFLTDPPYGLKFMNKHWDHEVPKVEIWKEVFRTLKPGGHILVACGTRTQHRMAVNIEDAGFEIRDVISWIYGSGFPKSLDISKAIDKQAGAEREVIGFSKHHSDGRKCKAARFDKSDIGDGDGKIDTLPSTDEAIQWNGWGTALKPATEFWTLARKPLSENTVAENVLKHGTGGINIDDCRIEFKSEADLNSATWGRGTDILGGNYVGAVHSSGKENIEANNKGRFPANVIFDEAMGKELDKQTGILTSGAMTKPYGYTNNGFSLGKPTGSTKAIHESNEGGASRFFYCPKADGFERNKGLKDFEHQKINDGRNKEIDNAFQRGSTLRKNTHPTVKPIDLMRYFVKLITPKGGIVCDPFAGSGPTGIAAKLELINYVLIEREAEYCEISKARIAAWNPDKYKSQTLFA